MTTSEAIADAMGFPAPVVRSVTVNADPERAFQRFTAEIDRWWPLASHSVSEGAAESVRFEPETGGKIVEILDGKPFAIWGTVTAWEPPRRVCFTWHAGEPASEAQDIEVTFAPVDGGTRVTLTQTGFERSHRNAAKLRKAYNVGWIYVLGLYAQERSVRMLALGALVKLLTLAARLKGRKRTGEG